MEQTLNQRNSSRNVNGTFSLKSLANKILEQNKKGNKPGTAASKSVPSMPHSSSACGTNAEVGCKGEAENFLDEFNKHVAIMEYEGDFMCEKAEGLKQNKENIKIAAEKETRINKNDRFKTNANALRLSAPSEDIFDKESLLYDFEERIAIAAYDGHQDPIQAQRIAYLDAFMAILATLPYENVEHDWVEHRIKTAKVWLAEQGIEQSE